jgi:Na+/H+ antiporter
MRNEPPVKIMEHYRIVLVILGLIILLTALAERLNWSSPIFLIISGIAFSFMPGFKHVHTDSEVIFLLVLPPLLFDAAIKIPQRDLKEQFSTVGTLAFGLVFITTIGIGLLCRFMIPGMTWSLAFLLGAILAATDAVAAIGVTKNLGLSHKTSVILEGESLLNDASALVAYQFALASVAGAAFIWWKAGLTFMILISGGALLGIVMAFVMGFLLRIVRHNATAVNSFLLLAPFVIYLLAEEIHVSGVIAVVVLGFAISSKAKVHFSQKMNLQSENIWELVIFLLNGMIFILIGLELKEVISNLDRYSIAIYCLYAFIITITAIAIRAWRIFTFRKRIEKGLTNPRFNKKGRISENNLISVEESIIISLSGMRGIVSLAIALALPLKMHDGSPFPMRAEILFITFMVIFYSVVGQGLLLPFVIKKLSRQRQA